MRVMGAETDLATGTTKFTTAGAVRVSNTSGTAGLVTVRNAADDDFIQKQALGVPEELRNEFQIILDEIWPHI